MFQIVITNCLILTKQKQRCQCVMTTRVAKNTMKTRFCGCGYYCLKLRKPSSTVIETAFKPWKRDQPP